MKIKGLIGLLLIGLWTSTLTGCQLALEGAGDGARGDRLAGVLVTREHLDLFDFEGYLKDNMGKISGGEIAIDNPRDRYQGRLYAVLKDRVLTDEDTGEETITKEYVFEEIEGSLYIAATIPEGESGDIYITTGSDRAISDGHSGFFQGDDEEKISLEGIIYISSLEGLGTHFINPVYQDNQGRVYAMEGSGMTINGVEGEGAAFSQTLEETTTSTEGGKSKKVSTSIKISLETILPPTEIFILQMDKNNSILSSEKYYPGQVPDKLIPKGKTAYIIVETHKKDSTGNMLVIRELFSKEDESLSTFFCREDGICIKEWTQLIWEAD